VFGFIIALPFRRPHQPQIQASRVAR